MGLIDFVVIIYCCYYYFVYRYPILLSDSIGRAHAEYRRECIIIHVIKYVMDVRFTLFTSMAFSVRGVLAFSNDYEKFIVAVLFTNEVVQRSFSMPK